MSFGAEVSPAKAVAGLQGEDGHDDYSEAEEESVYSEEEPEGCCIACIVYSDV